MVVVDVDVVDFAVWVAVDSVSLWHPAMRATVPVRAWRSVRREGEGIPHVPTPKYCKTSHIEETYDLTAT
jgi:hypothetical protein